LINSSHSYQRKHSQPPTPGFGITSMNEFHWTFGVWGRFSQVLLDKLQMLPSCIKVVYLWMYHNNYRTKDTSPYCRM